MGNGLQLLLAAVLGIGLALFCIRCIDNGVRPTIIAIAQSKAKNAVTSIVNAAVDKTIAAEGIDYDDMVAVQTDFSGRITALTSHFTQMNRLRSQIMDEIICKVDTLDTGSLGIPLGNLTGLSALSGTGPVLPVRVLSVAAVNAEFRNQFSAAGINQTHHQVLLDVTVVLKLLLPGGAVETDIKTQVNVAETVIVGQVPDAYLQFGQTQ
ncbi:MAG: sporulation protein YunB [Pseudoflavonifractor sp.]